MKRRSFIASLFAASAAPVVAKAVPAKVAPMTASDAMQRLATSKVYTLNEVRAMMDLRPIPDYQGLLFRRIEENCREVAALQWKVSGPHRIAGHAIRS